MTVTIEAASGHGDHWCRYTDICVFTGSKFVFLLPQKPPVASSTGANLLFAPDGRKKGMMEITAFEIIINQIR